MMLEIETDDFVESDFQMGWASPRHTREEVNRAGRLLSQAFGDVSSDSIEVEDALTIIGNWRSSHSFPLNTFQNGMRKSAKRICRDCLVAQRLKRLSSIALKLRRFPEMKLSQMQDIAGCRAILESVSQVDQLVDFYKKHSRIKHKLVHEDDYIQQPRQSGYRSHHLVYRYFSDRTETYNDLKIEMQLRSPLQHAWATAVETVGAYIQQALKSSQGEGEWLRFFALMGTAIAERERTAPVPNTPTNKKELKAELRALDQQLNVENHLTLYLTLLDAPEQIGSKHAHYFLLELDLSARKVTVAGYQANELEKANRDYLAVERKAISSPGGRDAVLVSVDSLAAVKRAYPNYFLDTHRFIQAVKQAIR